MGVVIYTKMNKDPSIHYISSNFNVKKFKQLHPDKHAHLQTFKVKVL